MKTVFLVTELLAIAGGIAAFFVLPYPKGMYVGAGALLIAAASHFLRTMKAEPAIGPNDAPALDPAKDMTGGDQI